MNNIFINRFNYYGENYYYESPPFSNGLNLITGTNGSGKSTFSDLIYYALGGTVIQFKESNTEVHREIINDKKNFVELFITVNNESFKFIRKFNSEESNIIVIQNLDNNETDSFPINRKISEDYIFSDWILEKLRIPKIKLYQGTASFYLGFPDILRLLYHNQLSDSVYIFKQPDGRSNYVNDSSDIRKTIFEVLTSSVTPDYYNSINEIKIASNKILVKKEYIDMLINFSKEKDDEFGTINSNHIEEEINSLLIDKKYYESKLSEYEKITKKDSSEEIDNLQSNISYLQDKYLELEYNIKALAQELEDFYTLHNIQKTEIRNVERIIASSNFFGISSPNCCPICGHELDRESGKCICGADLDETNFQNFFMTKNDHNTILKSKKVAITTTEKSINFIKSEIDKKANDINKVLTKIEGKRKLLYSLIADTPNEQLIKKIKHANDKILEIEMIIQKNNDLLKLVDKYETEYNNLRKIEEIKANLEREFIALKAKHIDKMQVIIKQISGIYETFLKNADKEIFNAKIDEEYEPVINDGFYSNVAKKVPRRLFYYLSLLSLSFSEEIPFPKFLLIDTPQNFGIDAEALKKIFIYIESFCLENNDKKFQIILTIKDSFVEHLTEIKPIYKIDDTKLLIKRKKGPKN